MSMPFVFLWDAARHGTPKSYEQALEMWDDLYHRSEKEETVSEKLAAFGEEFGQFIDNSGDESWLNVLAGTGAHARRCRSAVLRLELPDTDWQPVLVKMVEVANKHGLVALHSDGGSLFLPNGKVLPTGRAKAWKGLQAALKQEGGFPQTLGKFKAWLSPQVEMMLVRHGIWDKGVWPLGENPPAFFRDDGERSGLYIKIESREDYGAFAFDIGFLVVNSHVSDICSKFRFLSPGNVIRGGASTSIMGNGYITAVKLNGSQETLAFLVMCEKHFFLP